MTVLQATSFALAWSEGSPGELGLMTLKKILDPSVNLLHVAGTQEGLLGISLCLYALAEGLLGFSQEDRQEILAGLQRLNTALEQLRKHSMRARVLELIGHYEEAA